MPVVCTTIANGETAATLAAAVAGSGISVVGGTPLFQGNTLAAGKYVGAKRDIPPTTSPKGCGLILDTGVALGTGRLRIGALTPLPGGSPGGDPEDYNDDLGESNQAFAQPIATINGVPLTTVHDACSLKFSFIPTLDLLTLSFWFLSYEYPEFIGSAFTDTFLALLGGVNIALIPGTSVFISINTVNATAQSRYFVTNPLNFSTSLRGVGGNGIVVDNTDGASPAGVDGLGNWKPVIVTTPVTPGNTYVLELMIADLTDGNYESAVMFPTGGLTSTEGLGCATTVPTGADSGGAAGCPGSLATGSDSGGASGCSVVL